MFTHLRHFISQPRYLGEKLNKIKMLLTKILF